MAGFANTFKQALLGHAFKIAAMPVPTHLYVALMHVEPADDGTGGTEVVGTGYARAICDAWAWDAALHGVKNNVDALFPLAGASDWTQAVAFAIYDGPTAGNLLAHGALAAPVTPSSGDQIDCAINSLVIRFNP